MPHSMYGAGANVPVRDTVGQHGRQEEPALQHQEVMRLNARRRTPLVDEVDQPEQDHRAERERDSGRHRAATKRPCDRW